MNVNGYYYLRNLIFKNSNIILNVNIICLHVMGRNIFFFFIINFFYDCATHKVNLRYTTETHIMKRRNENDASHSLTMDCNI